MMLTFSPPADFVVWCLQLDGLKVPPFDSHLGGTGRLRAKGLTAENWSHWLGRVTTFTPIWQVYYLAAATSTPVEQDVREDWEHRRTSYRKHGIYPEEVVRELESRDKTDFAYEEDVERKRRALGQRVIKETEHLYSGRPTVEMFHDPTVALFPTDSKANWWQRWRHRALIKELQSLWKVYQASDRCQRIKALDERFFQQGEVMPPLEPYRDIKHFNDVEQWVTCVLYEQEVHYQLTPFFKVIGVNT